MLGSWRTTSCCPISLSSKLSWCGPHTPCIFGWEVYLYMVNIQCFNCPPKVILNPGAYTLAQVTVRLHRRWMKSVLIRNKIYPISSKHSSLLWLLCKNQYHSGFGYALKTELHQTVTDSVHILTVSKISNYTSLVFFIQKSCTHQNVNGRISCIWKDIFGCVSLTVFMNIQNIFCELCAGLKVII